MRQDMYKIICERPRYGGRVYDHHPYRKAKRVVLTEGDCLDEFSGHTKLPMKPIGLGWDDYKRFNDYLNPLFRFIESQVGRPWNDVFSEICENITLSSTTRRHVREHVDDHVELHCFYDEDGEISYNGRWGPRKLYRGDLYVDPKDGILRKVPKTGRRRYGRYDPNWREKQAGNLVEINDGLCFRRETIGEGRFQTTCWFKHYSIVVDRVRQVWEYDAEGKGVARLEVYKERVQVKDTASKKEIRDYGLNG